VVDKVGSEQLVDDIDVPLLLTFIHEPADESLIRSIGHDAPPKALYGRRSGMDWLFLRAPQSERSGQSAC
jgi:hypothetical protein